jgi:hypothetical protein
MFSLKITTPHLAVGKISISYSPIMKIYLFLSFVVFGFCSCAGQSGSEWQVVELELSFYHVQNNSAPKLVQSFKQRVWYKDSIAIEEVRSITITDSNGKSETRFLVTEYRFNDLRSKTIYVYKNLSDTATLIKKYSFQDSVPVIGGWGFNLKKELAYEGEPEAMKDTVVGGVHYKRYRLQRNNNNRPFYSIVLLRCDETNPIFNLAENLNQKFGCVCAGVYNYSQGQSQTVLTIVNFLKADLTPMQKKVFKAWEENASENRR